MNENIDLNSLRVETTKALRMVENTIENLCVWAHGFSEKLKALEAAQAQANLPKAEVQNELVG